ncbi:MAG: DUF748 domain-containing protein [Chitinophagales bacterium]|nr:DUF748 domain-containing protein [Chitinophagales bacterium]
MLVKKLFNNRWKKILIIFSIIIIAFVAVVIFFISPITKYLIEKYDVEYTGREIKIDWALVNPFGGSVHLSNVKIYEQNSDSIFFSSEGVDINISILKLLSKTYEITSLTLDRPHAIVSQNDTIFNFSDLIEKFIPEEIVDTTKLPVRFNILNVEIIKGEFKYAELLIPVNYAIRELNFKSTGKYWNTDSVTGTFSFLPGTGNGDVSGDFMINFKTKDYRIATVAHQLDLNIIEQYMKDIVNYGSFSASIDADVKAKGNLGNTQSINMYGKMSLNDFHFGKNPKEDYASFDKLTVGILELNPENKKYFFDSIVLSHPYFKYERYDSLDNLQNMFGIRGANVTAANANPEKFNLILEIADYLKIIFANFLKSDYTINSLVVNNGNLKFNDYSLNEKYSAALNPFSLKADSVNNKNEWVKVTSHSGIKPFGVIDVAVKMNPKDNKDFDLHYKLQNISAASFNPYLITYTSFPVDRGVVEMNGNWVVRNDNIASTNHFLVVDIRVTKKIKRTNTKWLPMPLILAFIREKGNVIDYEIPITGDLNNPSFHISDVIDDLIKNIFIKPPSIHYQHNVKTTEIEIEKSISLSYAMRQTILSHDQEKFLNKISDFLKKNPDASISVIPFYYTEKEKEYILFFEAKKKYFFSLKENRGEVMTESDSLFINKMSQKDLLFLRYLNNHVNNAMLFTVQDKCYQLIGAELVNKKFAQLETSREKIFQQYFKENGTDKQVKILSKENTIPFNGFSFLKIKYESDFPETLMSAYENLRELNTEPIRTKYSEQRKGIFLKQAE